VPKAKIYARQITLKKKNKNKLELVKGKEVDSNNNLSATQKPVQSARRNPPCTALLATRSRDKGASKANANCTKVTKQPAKKRR
jgi:hypothetical protein